MNNLGLDMKWTNESVIKLFNMGKRYKTKRTLMMAEKNRDIPTANRIDRGSVKVRIWETGQLPEIGEKFGFLDKPKNQGSPAINVGLKESA